jgi:FMN phosphatase YigB (HAD superfamily)
MKQNIINFFDSMTKLTNNKITGVDSVPIIYWGETYVTGVKIDDAKNIMVRFKIIKKINLTTLEGNKTDYYMMNPDADFWMPYEFLDEQTINETLKELQEKIIKLTNFDILNIKHKNNTTEETVSEGIIFTSKRLACKEAMNYKKIYKDTRINFVHIGKEEKNNYSPFEAATVALN